MRLHPTLHHHIVNALGWPELRPLQAAAVGPVLDGEDALLLAPTAGGKTEAAVFPLLSLMEADGWSGLSVIYVCPLKALLNNLLPRLETYGGWLGRRVALWHGDVTAARRQAILRNPPDILLTTPESLESMMVSTKVDHRMWFGDLRAIVVDEVHAFAGDDRGWHLLCVLERLTHLCGRPIQRLGLSATVGNPPELLAWLQGSSKRPARVIAPEAGPAPAPDVGLDYVGSVPNAARVIAALHRGEKRLVFCDSRSLVEQLGASLRELGVTVFLSHASLSMDERRRAEQAFTEARDCVIVSTSTLELGIDVGDLDRVIQVNAPSSVASFLQRLGRTGRRSGTRRNCLFLALTHDDLLTCAGLLLLWSRGYVEPIVAPPSPQHIVAQQILALALQEHRIGSRLWQEWWNGLGLFGPSALPVAEHLVAEGFLESDGPLWFIGPEAEKHFGRRHFMGLTAVFTAAPEFAVLHGRQELGKTDPSLLTASVDGPRLILLGGRTWRVTWVDWKRRRCFVEPYDGGGGRARWVSSGIGGVSFAVARAMRDVLLGEDPPVSLSQRAVGGLAAVRKDNLEIVHPGGTVIVRAPSGDLRWWTWAGYRGNTTLKATLGSLADESQRVDDLYLRLRGDLTAAEWRSAAPALRDRLCLPEVDDKAVDGLKFSAALPRRLAVATLSTRLAALDTAATVLDEPQRFTIL
ncbi:DEAD/DEAH box helicase [Streptosporangium sp. LJ11]|uniref:DEAD/DEAH box helicase n=1 Tax=Streptosporangium sp. LJ11 TaxID=3436927 RepID=UPI003F7B11C6